MRWIYLSPHLDDAALSAGGLIYDQTNSGIPVEIWTFMCGFPPENEGLSTDYRLQVDQPDVILRPQVADIDILEHVDVHEVVRRGEQAVDTALPELKKMFAWQNRLRRTLGI